MKTNYLFIVLLLCLATSCKHMQTCVITGQPGTRIFDLNGEYVTEIEANGKAKMNIGTSKGALPYHTIYQAQAPGSNQLVPFGIDYTFNHFKRQNGSGATMSVLGPAALVSGAVVWGVYMSRSNKYSKNKSGNESAIGLGVGMPLFMIGTFTTAFSFMPFCYRDVPHSIDANEKLRTNEDLVR